jgi:hypothetical protein
MSEGDKNGPAGSGGDAALENPTSLIETTSEGGPTSLNLAVGPPSPLTGSYLLIVIGEPYSQEHKDIILQKLLKGEFAAHNPILHKISDVTNTFSFCR